MNFLQPHIYRYFRMIGILLVFALIACYFTGVFSENILFIMLYVLLTFAGISLIGFLIYQLITNSSVVKQFVIALGGLILIVGTALIFSLTDSSLLIVKSQKAISFASCAMGSTIFYCIYIILAMAIAGIIITEIRNLLKR